MEAGAVYQKKNNTTKPKGKKEGIKLHPLLTAYIYSSLLFSWLHFSRISYLHPFGCRKLTRASVHNCS